MKQNHAMLLFAGVVVLGMLGMMTQPRLTGSAVQEHNLTLLSKIYPPCFCKSQGNITEQQKAFYSIVESAELALQRKEISEQIAIKILNNTAQKTCEKCSRDN